MDDSLVSGKLNSKINVFSLPLAPEPANALPEIVSPALVMIDGHRAEIENSSGVEKTKLNFFTAVSEESARIDGEQDRKTMENGLGEVRKISRES
ncbi:hypothetical protein RUM44_006598 [Polyplax serrata]|uniref:Uncharacterized protein n=1 Tax=Polyplax serrata TaxID=468196 RepID=A0ABR1AIR9_POLSC